MARVMLKPMPVQKTRSLKPQNQHILIGAKTIAQPFGCSAQTIYRWRRHLGFPACKLPNGQLAITYTLIDQWLLARHMEQRKNGRQHQS